VIIAVARVHMSLLTHPPEGSEDHLGNINGRLQSVVYLVPFIFPETRDGFNYHHAEDACGASAILGMQLLENGKVEVALACGSAIANIAANAAASRPEPYGLAALQEKIEVLARASDALGEAGAAAAFRAMVQRPPSVSDADWPHSWKPKKPGAASLSKGLQRLSVIRGGSRMIQFLFFAKS
jgi:hypothetical protein